MEILNCKMFDQLCFKTWLAGLAAGLQRLGAGKMAPNFFPTLGTGADIVSKTSVVYN
jgi:hypothetical protein